jgi:hypothetical protein
MAHLTINTTPSAIALAGNGLKYEVETNNHILTQGVPGHWTVAITGALVENHNFGLFCDLFSVEFTVKASPDESGNQVHTTATPFVQEDAKMLLMSDLSKNYYISKYCTLELIPDSGSFFINLKTCGNFTTHQVGITNVLTIANYEGTTEVINPNYRIGCLIESNDVIIGEEEKFPFPANSVEFDISDYVRNLASGDFTYPAPASDILVKHESACVPYYAKFYEKYGSTPVPKQIVADSLRYALPGGLDATMLADLANDETDWKTVYLDAKNWLTWAPDPLYVSVNDTLRLFALVKSDTPFSLHLYSTQIHDEVATITNFHSVGNGLFSSDYCVIEAIIDPAKLFTVEQLATLTEFRVKLVTDIEQAPVDLTVARTFYMLPSVPDQRLEFVFANSHEIAFDTIHATGIAEFSLDLENYTTISIDKSQAQSRSARTDKMKINSGYISFEQLYYWQEFIQSSHRYLIRDGRRIPVRIVSSDVFVFRNKEYNYAVALEIEVDNADAYRTTLPEAGLFSDFFNSSGYAAYSSSIGGGHIIIDADGVVMTQQGKLQFTGDLVTVTNNPTTGTTVVDIACYWDKESPETIKPANGEMVMAEHIAIDAADFSGNLDDECTDVQQLAEAVDALTISSSDAYSVWNPIDISDINTTPATTLSITTNANLSATVLVGDVVRVTIGGVYYYGYVSESSFDVGTGYGKIAIYGEALSGTITELYYGKQGVVGGWNILPQLIFYGSFADADNATLIITDILTQVLGRTNFKLIGARFFCTEIDSAASPDAQATVTVLNSTAIFTPVELVNALTWYYTTIANSSYTTMSSSQAIEISVTAATGTANKDAKNLTVEFFCVKTDLE